MIIDLKELKKYINEIKGKVKTGVFGCRIKVSLIKEAIDHGIIKNLNHKAVSLDKEFKGNIDKNKQKEIQEKVDMIKRGMWPSGEMCFKAGAKTCNCSDCLFSIGIGEPYDLSILEGTHRLLTAITKNPSLEIEVIFIKSIEGKIKNKF